MGGDERASLLQPRGACVCVEDLGYAREAKGGMSMELSGVNFVARPRGTRARNSQLQRLLSRPFSTRFG